MQMFLLLAIFNPSNIECEVAVCSCMFRHITPKQGNQMQKDCIFEVKFFPNYHRSDVPVSSFFFCFFSSFSSFCGRPLRRVLSRRASGCRRLAWRLGDTYWAFSSIQAWPGPISPVLTRTYTTAPLSPSILRFALQSVKRRHDRSPKGIGGPAARVSSLHQSWLSSSQKKSDHHDMGKYFTALIFRPYLVPLLRFKNRHERRTMFSLWAFPRISPGRDHCFDFIWMKGSFVIFCFYLF